MSKPIVLWAARDENTGRYPETIVLGLKEPSLNMSSWVFPANTIVMTFPSNAFDFTLVKGHKTKVKVHLEPFKE